MFPITAIIQVTASSVGTTDTRASPGIRDNIVTTRLALNIDSKTFTSFPETFQHLYSCLVKLTKHKIL